MTRRHFQAIADSLKDSKPALFKDLPSRGIEARRIQWRIDCESMADVCRQFNSRFDRDRFLRACGLEA